MRCWHLHIKGQVQGVGFRPHVYQLAKELHVNGWVSNDVNGVHVAFCAEQELADAFANAVIDKHPAQAVITSSSLTEIESQSFIDFTIVHREDGDNVELLLTPDFAMCADCKLEIETASDRRYQYAFTTCTNCGPRYSIIKSLPYDRERTEMDVFEMCTTCSAEYNDPTDRRYFSQTNSCGECGVKLDFNFNMSAERSRSTDTISTNPDTSTPLGDHLSRRVQHCLNAWHSGQIVAIKGIGGYLLTCAATDEAAVNRLRERKHRPTKPLAVMYPSIESLTEFEVSEIEKGALESTVAPIVLLQKKKSCTLPDAIAPGLSQVGVMLPYTPLYHILLKNYGLPIIATSANISSSPIIYKDQVAQEQLEGLADYILGNDREITIPQDDSVVKYSSQSKTKIIIRRSRGLAPSLLIKDLQLDVKNVLATGAMLKSTFAIQSRSNLYTSQYIGDLQSYDTQLSYRHTLDHLTGVLRHRRTVVLSDLHPEYPSTHMATEIASQQSVRLEQVQHHQAHFAAILGEHNLMDRKEPVLGIIWDGTGLGDDGQIWGGEFFRYQEGGFTRAYYFDYFPSILGDKMAQEPRISALSACKDIPYADDILESKFSSAQLTLYKKLLAQESNLLTSSVGRIFDAVASLLGLADTQSYEGEAAMLLEKAAQDYLNDCNWDFSDSYFQDGAHRHRVPTKTLFDGIVRDILKGKETGYIAAKFHYSMMHIVKIVAGHMDITKLAFSGGVFQNGVLVDLIQQHLSETHQLYFHQQLSPNDENISFGQIIYHHINSSQLERSKTQDHVLSNTR